MAETTGTVVCRVTETTSSFSDSLEALTGLRSHILSGYIILIVLQQKETKQYQ